MASLKTAAKARAKARRSKGPEEDDGISVDDHLAPPEEYKPSPSPISGQTYDQPPPLPTALMYIRYLSQVPAVRNRRAGPFI